MTTMTSNALHDQSRRLQSGLSWVVGFGAFLLFSQIFYIPIKGLFFAIGTPDIANATEQLLISALRSLPVVALLAALWTTRQLFKIYAGGAILSEQSGRKIGRLGDWLTASAILALVVGPASAQMDAVTGAYISTQIALICVGLAIRLLGRVQSLAAEIASDHAQIV